MNDEQRMREAIVAHIDSQPYNFPDGTFTEEQELFCTVGYRARDAEVRKLRELVDHAKRIFQNAEVRSGYCMCGETPERHGQYADCQYTDRGQWASELWLKREEPEVNE